MNWKSGSATSTAAAVVIVIIIIVAAILAAEIYSLGPGKGTGASSSLSSASLNATSKQSGTLSTRSTSSQQTAGTLSTTSLLPVGCTSSSTRGTYRVGVLEPLNGSLGMLGKELYDAADLAASQWNQTGGIPDRSGVCHPIQLVVANASPDQPGTTINSTQALLAQGIQAFVGPCCFDISNIATLLIENRAALVSPSASANELEPNQTSSSPQYLYRIDPGDANQTLALASIIKARGYLHVEAVVSNEPYGLGIGNGLKSALANATGIKVKILPINPGPSAYATYPGLIQEVEGDAPNVIVYAGFIGDLIVFWKDVEQTGSLNFVPTLAIESLKSSTFFPFGRGNAGPCAMLGCPVNSSAIASYMFNSSMIGTSTLLNSSSLIQFQNDFNSTFGISCANGGCPFAPQTFDAENPLFRAMKDAGVYNGTSIASQIENESRTFIGVSGMTPLAQNTSAESSYSLWMVKYNNATGSWSFAGAGSWSPKGGLNCTSRLCASNSTTSASTTSSAASSLVSLGSEGAAFAAVDLRSATTTKSPSFDPAPRR